MGVGELEEVAELELLLADEELRLERRGEDESEATVDLYRLLLGRGASSFTLVVVVAASWLR